MVFLCMLVIERLICYIKLSRTNPVVNQFPPQVNLMRRNEDCTFSKPRFFTGNSKAFFMIFQSKAPCVDKILSPRKQATLQHLDELQDVFSFVHHFS